MHNLHAELTHPPEEASAGQSGFWGTSWKVEIAKLHKEEPLWM